MSEEDQIQDWKSDENLVKRIESYNLRGRHQSKYVESFINGSHKFSDIYENAEQRMIALELAEQEEATPETISKLFERGYDFEEIGELIEVKNTINNKDRGGIFRGEFGKLKAVGPALDNYINFEEAAFLIALKGDKSDVYVLDDIVHELDTIIEEQTKPVYDGRKDIIDIMYHRHLEKPTESYESMLNHLRFDAGIDCIDPDLHDFDRKNTDWELEQEVRFASNLYGVKKPNSPRNSYLDDDE